MKWTVSLGTYARTEIKLGNWFVFTGYRYWKIPPYEDELELAKVVVKVLNRELPGGKPRVRRKGVKSGKACGSED